MRTGTIALWLVAFWGITGSEVRAAEPVTAPDGWQSAIFRDEIAPAFSYQATAGRNNGPALVINSDARPGLHGFWTKTYPVEGGRYYRFQAYRKLAQVDCPRQSALVRVLWQDAAGKKVVCDNPLLSRTLKNYTPMAEAEYPRDKPIGADGWTEVSDVFRAPSKAAKALVELHLLWAPRGEIRWSDVSLAATSAPAGRRVRLAAVHYVPRGSKTPADNCRQFVPLIEEAARQRADFVVLGETLTYAGTGRQMVECAEPVPGPSTEFFGQLARKHNLYIVAGLIERDGHLIYNTAALVGPDGQLTGKYRKVCLPRDEVTSGVEPGTEYPVFSTRFGKVGMMVCYDGFFPEVARQLTVNGAEVIAWPVWGCNPRLASARACENHVYVVSSTYTGSDRDWMLTAIYDHEGEPIVKADKFGSVIVAEVDLDTHLYWPSIGDFKSYIDRHRPPWDKGSDVPKP